MSQSPEHFFPATIIDYSEIDFPFTDVMEEILNLLYLSRAHELFDVVEVADRKADQKTKLHSNYYNSPKEFFHACYHEFLQQVVAPHLQLKHRLIYQVEPNLRVHFPGSRGVGEFHKDTKYDHSQFEINFWLPLTNVWGTNTIWIETEPDKGDYRSYDLFPGQCLVFQGGLLTHGNQVNDTDSTRISFDFRVLKPEHYNPDRSKSSVNTGCKFVIGEYFAELDLQACSNPCCSMPQSIQTNGQSKTPTQHHHAGQ